jgi:hypothetical protein
MTIDPTQGQDPFGDPVPSLHVHSNEHSLVGDATLPVGKDASLTLGTDSLIVLGKDADMSSRGEKC